MASRATVAKLVRDWERIKPLIRTAEQQGEIDRCGADFWHWSTSHIRIMDKSVGRRVPFSPYPGQRLIADQISSGQWLWLLKARRLGATAIVLLLMLHRLTFRRDQRAIAVSQDMQSSVDLIRWYNDLDGCQPAWMRQPRSKSNETCVAYANGSQLNARAGTEHAGRSLDCDVLLCDEARNIASLDEVLKAGQPTLETSGGVSIVISTAGPIGNAFHRGWMSAGESGSKYMRRFLAWDERPGRDEEWYSRESEAHKSQPTYMSREYPRSATEAFMAAGGRCFPRFDEDSNVVHCDRPEDAPAYRSMDFGSRAGHAFACLWAWHDEHALPRLTFEPGCDDRFISPDILGRYAQGIEQMWAYCRDEDRGDIVKVNDDIPDALRYLVTHFRMTGHVHVYRVLFIHNGDDQQWSPLQMFRGVMQRSGWELMRPEDNVWRPGPDHERYAATIGDRSAAGYMDIMRESQAFGGFDMSIAPHRPIPGVPSGEQREQGIAWINSLITGDHPFHAVRHKDAEEFAREAALSRAPQPSPDGCTMLLKMRKRELRYGRRRSVSWR